MKRLLLLSLLLAPGLASADLYDQPYSIIQTDASRSADYLLLPVLVNRVDGQNAQYNNRAVVDPGRHEVTIDVRARKGFHLPTQTTFELETRPCMRYYVAARLETTAGQRWKPVVRHEELIGECAEKFHIAGAK